MKKLIKYFALISILVYFSSLSIITGQDNKSDQESKTLFKTVVHLDSVLFDAFNARNLDTLKTMFSLELEFYHDLGGFTDYDQNMESFKRTFESERRLRRELIPGSLEICPIKDYGAVETGIHRFYATEKGQKEQLSSEAKFILLWERRDGQWRVTRVISYGHQEHL